MEKIYRKMKKKASGKVREIREGKVVLELPHKYIFLDSEFYQLCIYWKSKFYFLLAIVWRYFNFLSPQDGIVV